jgi:hypothetical protein
MLFMDGGGLFECAYEARRSVCLLSPFEDYQGGTTKFDQVAKRKILKILISKGREKKYNQCVQIVLHCSGHLDMPLPWSLTRRRVGCFLPYVVTRSFRTGIAIHQGNNLCHLLKK